MSEEEKNDCRIDITWYDGVYMEDPTLCLTKERADEYKENQKKPDSPANKSASDTGKDKPKKIGSQKNNLRQIEIFIKEMLPELMKKLQSKNPPTVCVLSPFRIQLQLLKEYMENDKELKKTLGNAFQTDIEADNQDDDLPKNDNPDTLQSLSIHKAQGKGYDIVYLMTVEDNYENSKEPWGQKMRTINVAASRAKKELHVITSSIWIPQYIHKELPEFEGTAPLPDYVRAQLNGRTEEAFYERLFAEGEKNDKSKENLYIGRLCKWVYDNRGAWEQNNSRGKFGFRKTATSSVFDGFTNDADPHKVIKKALMDSRRDLTEADIKTRVSLNAAPDLVKELKDPRAASEWETPSDKALAEEDFIFICKDNRIKVIVHVLDENYRNACAEQEQYGFYSWLNDSIKQTRGKDKYIAIPTNGALGGEDEKILEKFDKSKENLIFKENNAIGLLNSKTRECFEAVSQMVYDDEGRFKLVPPFDDEKNDIINKLKLDYSDPENVKYDLLSQQYYLCRYGTAYAFEYALMYDIVFRCAKTKSFDILSLGCGSGIDALAAEYSRAGKDLTLSYHGVDRVKWDVSFLDDSNDFTPQDIVGYFASPENRIIRSDVIFFPKILNELPPKTLKELLAAVRECSLDTDKEEYFFCVSHASSKADNDSKLAKQIINALKNHERYTCSDSIISFFDFNKDEKFKNRWGLKVEGMLTDNSGIYRLNPDKTVEIKDLNPDFLDKQTDIQMKGIVNNLKRNVPKELVKDPDEFFRHRRKTAMPIAFQIIRLEKKK